MKYPVGWNDPRMPVFNYVHRLQACRQIMQGFAPGELGTDPDYLCEQKLRLLEMQEWKRRQARTAKEKR
jgi:hypothetical protein